VGLAAAGAKRLFFFRSKLSLPGGEGPASRSELRDGMLFAHPAEPAEQMGDRGAVAQAGGLAERRQIAEESVDHTLIVGDGIAAESSGPASGCCAWKRNSRVPLDWLIRPVRIRSHRHSRKMTKDWPVKGRTHRSASSRWQTPDSLTGERDVGVPRDPGGPPHLQLGLHI
jgi:hypothetical protein